MLFMTLAFRVLLVALIGATSVLPVFAQRIPIVTDDGANFSGDALMSGVSATEADCSRLTNAVWARLSQDEAECLRYWPSGLGSAGSSRVMVYLPGDQITNSRPDASYATRSPRSLQMLADSLQSRAGVPFILMSRPGLFGSSGDHKDRRTELEVRLVSAALDAIKARHGINEYGLVGLSGGGHTVAAMLALRNDVVCAVPASAVSSPRLRWSQMGLKADLTGRMDSYEPVEHLRPGIFNPRLRVFVMGDPKDTNVPWATQLPLAIKLKALGVEVQAVNAEGSDLQRHAIGNSSQRIGSLCTQNRTTADILKEAEKGLKG